MTVQRRDVLKGLAVAGISGAVSGAGANWIFADENRRTAAAPPARSIYLLAAASSQREAFIAGAARALGAEPTVIRLGAALHDDISQAEKLLASRLPLIALVRPADGVLLRELARGHGLRIAFEGQHTIGDSDWPQRHRFTTLPQSAGLGRSVLGGFGNQDYIVTETPLAETPGAFHGVAGFAAYRVNAQRSLTMHLADVPIAEGCAALGISRGSYTELAPACGTAALGSRSWAELLGSALAQVASGSWQPAARGAEAFAARGQGSSETAESLVSILIHA